VITKQSHPKFAAYVESIRPAGRIAEARVRGILRGGFVHAGLFYAHAGREIICLQITAVQELRYL